MGLLPSLWHTFFNRGNTILRWYQDWDTKVTCDSIYKETIKSVSFFLSQECGHIDIRPSSVRPSVRLSVQVFITLSFMYWFQFTYNLSYVLTNTRRCVVFNTHFLNVKVKDTSRSETWGLVSVLRVRFSIVLFLY